MPDPKGAEGPTTETPTVELDPEVRPDRNGGDEIDPEARPSQIEPSSIFDDLREQYHEATEDRRITIPIAPGRFHGNLAARYRPGPWSDYRRRAERMMRRGGGSEEAELQFAAQTLVQCCETILYRPTDATELVPMHEANPIWRGGEPVRYDDRLAQAVGIDPSPGSATAICRLVFRNPAALNDHFVTLDAWLKEAIGSDEEDEDEGGRVPPT